MTLIEALKDAEKDGCRTVQRASDDSSLVIVHSTGLLRGDSGERHFTLDEVLATDWFVG
jgi:hypothetical protein